jgi:ubiquinone/menaquinone biosynthesis C-methylase UbiE
MFRDSDRKKCQQLFDKQYAGRKFSRGQYQEPIRQHVSPGTGLLDAACGRYLEFSRDLSDTVQVVGIDLEEQLDTRNGRSPYAIRGDLEHLLFPSNYFDVVISRSVVEHLTDPPRVFREFHRVLKPGGKVILSTPKKWDYISVAARLTPYIWHRALVSKMLGVSEDDVFPKLYRANTLSKLGRELQAAGFKAQTLKAVGHYPAYLMFSPMLFRIGMLYERLVAFNSFRHLRGTLLCVFEKAGAAAAGSRDARQTDRATEVGV